MRHLPSPALSLLLLGTLAACSADFKSGDDSADGADGGGDDGGAADGDAGLDGGDTVVPDDGIPSWAEDLDASGCDGYEGTPVPGAASYYRGAYEPRGGGEWRGVEQWVLLANDTWQSLGEESCVVTWNAVATESSPGACGVCDFGLSVSATVDEAATTCPEGLWATASDRNWSEDYAVFDDGGELTWFFAGSGNAFATGGKDGESLVYLTEKACKWF